MDNNRPQPEVRDFKGTVTSIEFSRAEGCHLFHVEYDSDSDDEDMELWEVKQFSLEEWFNDFIIINLSLLQYYIIYVLLYL